MVWRGGVGPGMVWFGVFWFGFTYSRGFEMASSVANGSSKNRLVGIGPEVTNGGEEAILTGVPYQVTVNVVGVADILFHRWNCEAVAEKAAAKKGSAAKKTDNIESYVYRDENNIICVPGEYLRMAIITAAKYRQDPRSPRKSAMDLYKAGIVSLTGVAPIIVGGKTQSEKWEYEHQCRVTVQRNGITRVRPAFRSGWSATFELMINVPELISMDQLNEVIVDAGRLVGLGDFRPSYGRFRIASIEKHMAR